MVILTHYIHSKLKVNLRAFTNLLLVRYFYVQYSSSSGLSFPVAFANCRKLVPKLSHTHL